MSLEMKYFILKPRSKSPGDPYAAASRKAIRVYAEMIKKQDSELAIDLKEWANKETEKEICLYGKEEI